MKCLAQGKNTAPWVRIESATDLAIKSPMLSHLRFIESSENTKNKGSKPYCAIPSNDSSSMTLDKLTMKARKSNHKFNDLNQDSLFKTVYKSKNGIKNVKFCLKYCFIT